MEPLKKLWRIRPTNLQAGVVLNARHARAHRMTKEQQEATVYLFLEQGKTEEEIAKIFGFSVSTIHRHLKERGIVRDKHPKPEEDKFKFKLQIKKARISSILAFDSYGRFLLGKDKDGLFHVPEGNIKNGESPEEAARRALLEETGLRAYSLTRVDIKEKLNKIELHLFSALVSGMSHNRLSSKDDISWDFYKINGNKLPKEVYDNLFGPLEKNNVIRQFFSRAEESIKKSEDFNERIISTLGKTTPRNTFISAIDENPSVIESALSRPEISSYLIDLLIHSKYDTSGKELGNKKVEFLLHPASDLSHIQSFRNLVNHG